jgi:hypothetical protein
VEYRSKPLGTSQSHVVVIHCSDPRYQPHFQDFLHAGLGLTHYGLIAIPGGVELLSPSETSNTLRNQGGAWFDFMCKLMTAQRCILIGHADCRWYVESRVEPDESCLKEHQSRDLNAVRAEIHRRFPLVDVELYFAELEGEVVSFTELAEPVVTTTSRTRDPRHLPVESS